jgi:hypothetical protein
MSEEIKARLEYLRGELQGERISYEELHELQCLAPHIDASDVELLEAAGVPEFPEDGPVLPVDDGRPVNEKSFEYVGRYGSKFTSDRCDFKNGVRAAKPSSLTEVKYTSDVAEMMGWWALHVYPHLNGFAGFDCIRFEVEAVD